MHPANQPSPIHFCEVTPNRHLRCLARLAQLGDADGGTDFEAPKNEQLPLDSIHFSSPIIVRSNISHV